MNEAVTWASDRGSTRLPKTVTDKRHRRASSQSSGPGLAGPPGQIPCSLDAPAVHSALCPPGNKIEIIYFLSYSMKHSKNLF